MSESLIHELAAQIAREQFLLQWETYGLMLAIAFVAVFGAAYLGAYARKRGEAFATKADFNDLISQLKKTTAAAEEVRTEISHADWANRELKTLRRLKLEELLQAVHELADWQDLAVSAEIFGSSKDVGHSPLPKVERLAGLFFPELRTHVYELCQLHRQIRIEMSKTAIALSSAAQNVATQVQVRGAFSNAYSALLSDQYSRRLAIEGQAREIMAELIGV